MEQLVSTGKVKSIGVSNFNSEQIARLLTVAKIVPTVNQIECSPQINQKKLTKFCRERNIVITGFCPLGHPNPAARTPSFMYDGRVKAIAEKYGKTPAQISLRYLVIVFLRLLWRKLHYTSTNFKLLTNFQVELGVVPIPKTVRVQRMVENINLFDFTLTPAEKEVMGAFNTGQRLVAMNDARKSPFWPYGIQY